MYEDESLNLAQMVIYLVVFLGVLGFLVWQVIKRTRALKEPIRDDQCVSCGSQRLAWPAAGVYRCQDCGYEGGSGMAALRAAAQQEAVASMSPDERRASALRDLHEARTLFTTIIDSESAFWESGGGVSMARADLHRAMQAMQEASMKLNDPYLAVAPQPESVGDVAAGEAVSTVAAVHDGQMLGGDFLVGAIAASSLEGMKIQSRELLTRVEAAIQHWGAAVTAGQ